MAMTARLDLSVWRNDDVYELPVMIRGLDLTLSTLGMQIRLGRDVPGPPLAALGKVTNGNAEGLRVAGVTIKDGVPVTDLRIRINRSTRQALPYSGEMGSDTALEYALVIDRQTRLVGRFILLAHAYESDAAPTSRAMGSYDSLSGSAPAGSVSMTIAGQEVVQLTVDGAGVALLAIDKAVEAQASAEGAAMQAETAASAASAFVGGVLFDTVAQGLAATPEGKRFSVVGQGPGNYTVLYKKVAGAAVEQTRLGSKLISVDDFTTPQAAAAYAQGTNADVHLPAGDVVGDIPDDSDAIFEGDGRLFGEDGVQISTYAEPRSRFVIGQEYLWAFHTAVTANPPGTRIDVATSGDSTTRGAFGPGNLPVQYQLDQMLAGQLNRYGLSGPVIHNRGTSGQTTREWIGAPASGRIVLADDIATYPNLSLYILRWGLNDGSFGPGYHDIKQYRADIWTALTRIRAWRGVDKLSIILMTPNTTTETGYRDEAWHEQMARILKKAARKFKCCFIDAYAIWRDGRAGVNLWLDDEGAANSGIHPDRIFNHWISDCIGRVAFAPISTIQTATNNFINESGRAVSAITGLVPASAFLRGVSIYRTAPGGTFPLDGIVIVTKSADGVTKQENIGFYGSGIPGTSEVSQQTCTRYALDGNAWSAWRDEAILLTLGPGWSLFAADNLAPLFQKSVGNVVTFNARLRNASATAGSSIGQFPVGFRPPVNMRFLVHNAAATTMGTIEVQTDGNIAWVSGDNSDVVVNLSFVAAA